MKKLTALFLALLLLTVCGQGMTAYAEDYEYEEESGDGYDEWTEDDEEWYDDEWYDDEEYDDEWYDDEYDETYMSGQGYSEEDIGDGEMSEDEEAWYESQLEPQIYFNDTEYNEELYEKYYGNKKRVDDSEIPEDIEKNADLIKRTTNGTIVVGGDRVSLYIDGELRENRPLGAVGDNLFISDNLESYPDSEYWAYGFVGDVFFGLVDESSAIIGRPCDEIVNTNGNVYCYVLDDGGALYLGTLMCQKYQLSRRVADVSVVGDYTIITKRDGKKYLLNASPYAISHASRDYLFEHSVPMVYLGNGSLSAYLAMLDQSETGESDEELAAKLKDKYGVDFSKWGNPRDDFKIEDLDQMNGLDFQEVYANYEIGEHDWKGSYLDLEYISCGYYFGNLHYNFNNDGKVSSVKYEALNCGEADFDEFRAYLQRAGGTELVEFTLDPNATTGYIYRLGDKRIYLEYTEGSNGNSGEVSISMVYGSGW
jgi:hypothetical protein